MKDTRSEQQMMTGRNKNGVSDKEAFLPLFPLNRIHMSQPNAHTTPFNGQSIHQEWALQLPRQGRKGGTSRTWVLTPLQRAKSTFPQEHPGASAALTGQITGQIRQELLHRPGWHDLGGLPRGSRGTYSNPDNISRPCTFPEQPAAAWSLQSPHHCS